MDKFSSRWVPNTFDAALLINVYSVDRVFHGAACYTWSHSPFFSMCQVDVHSDLPPPVVLVYRLSNYQLSAAELFLLPPQRSGLHCPKMYSLSIIHRLVLASIENFSRFQRSFCCWIFQYIVSSTSTTMKKSVTD